ncbi:MAG TPA: ATP-binding protein [Spirochaetota bacterium]|nr:ATP-binding protein [Spirochaetota bacterium]HPJ35120.1 ATP-binding protein [Spirochaetota bacterium]
MTEKEDRYYIDKIEKTVGRAINRYSLIAGDDRVVVGLSGGKDSLVLLETLAARRRRLPVTYSLFAVYVDFTNIDYIADQDYMRKFCEDLDVRFQHVETELDLSRESGKSICFLCSWHRRKILFNFAEEMQCGKLALGHHMDDALETLVMNMMYNGTMSSLPPSLSMFEGRLDVIRPMILLEKTEIDRYAEIRGFPSEIKKCPYVDENSRAGVKRIIEQMSSEDRRIKKNLFKSMSNIHNEYLPPEEK